MKLKIQTEGLSIISWTNNIEEGALKQAKNLALHPFAVFHVVLLPDVHEGFGMPIGAVLATENVVLPNAVGVDIGCGMCAIRSSLKKENITKEILQIWVQKIYSSIPMGPSHHKSKQRMPDFLEEPAGVVTRQEIKNIPEQLGTLGGGNHFIEIQYDEEGFVWIMLHSGSRNIGKKVADYYNRLAQDLNKKDKAQVPPSWNLAFLKVDSEEGQKYLSEMQYCLEFARENRFRMMEVIKKIISDTKSCSFGDIINIHHNYASFEMHFGKNLWIHRKGAIEATKNKIGIIPGSQGTPSYIVIGKGNAQSFCSSSHGAGRIMSRNQAMRTLILDDVKNRLNNLGIIHAVKKQKDLDEAPDCYKNIEQVIEEQKSLVDIVHKLYPMAVMKG